jgi:hypothetical protein
VCKNCVQHVNLAGKVLCTTKTYAHFCIQFTYTRMLRTVQAMRFTDITHILNHPQKQITAAHVSTFSTLPTVTTMYINNKNVMGGQKEFV